jgi:hypothetical protein
MRSPRYLAKRIVERGSTGFIMLDDSEALLYGHTLVILDTLA